jgi:hypothetical protein
VRERERQSEGKREKGRRKRIERGVEIEISKFRVEEKNREKKRKN